MRKKTSAFIASILIFLSFSRVVSPSSSPTVYILNSDNSIEKLFLAENAFKKYFTGRTKTFDLKTLGTEGNNLNKIISPAEQDLIYCIGSSALSFALKTYPKNRIIFSSIINWERFDLSELTYGVSNEAPLESQLTIFKYILPSIKKIGIVYSSEYNSEWIGSALKEAEAFNMKLVGIPYKDAKSPDKIFSELFPLVDAVWLIPDPGVITRSSFFEIIKQSHDAKKPLLTYNSVFVENGAVLSVSVDEDTVGQQISIISENLVSGKNIEEKIQMPAGSSISLNIKKAREFKLKINMDALGNINRLIE